MGLGTTLTLQVPHPAAGTVRNIILVAHPIGKRKQHSVHQSGRRADDYEV